MGKQKNDLDKLYEAVSSKFDIGDYETFKNKMTTPEQRRSFYDNVSERFDLGDYDSYESRLGKYSEVSPLGSENTSGQLSEPIPNTVLPENMPDQLQQPQNVNSSGQSLVGEGVVLPPGWATQVINGNTVMYDPKDPENTVENILPAVSVPVKREDKGVWRDLYNSLASGSASVGEGFASIPELLYNIAAIPQNAIADLTGNESLRADYADVSGGTANPLGLLVKASDAYKELSEENRARVTKFDNDILGSITDGNLLDAGRQVANSFVESIPAMIGMAATSGVGQAANIGAVGRNVATSLPFAGSKFQEIEENKNIPSSLKPVVALANGLSEVVFEEGFGTQNLIRGIIDKSVNGDGVKKFVTGYMEKLLANKGIAASAFKGSIDEMSTQLSQNIIDKYSGVDPNKDLWEGVADAGIVGFASDGVISGAGKAVNSTKLKKLQDQNVALVKDLDQADPETAEGIQAVVDENIKQIDEIETEVRREYNSLPDSAKKELSDISKRKAVLERTLNDQNISDESKEAVQSQIDEIDKQRDEVYKRVEDPEVKPVKTTSEPSKDLSPERVDESVVAQRKIAPELENVPMGSIELPDTTFDTIAKIESKEAITEDEITKAVDSLYEKKKELKSLKKDVNRLHTTEEIDIAIDNIDKDLEMLSTEPAEKVINITEIDFNSVPVGEAISYGDNQKGIVKGSKLLEDGSVDLQLESGEIINSKTIENDSNKVPVENIVENVEVAPVGEEIVPAKEVVKEKEVINEIDQKNEVVPTEAGQQNQEVVTELEQVKETRSNFADESEYNKYVAETSTNPDEVAVAYYNSTPIEYDFIEQGIMDDIGSSKINESDYARYGDRNNLDKAKRDRWIDKDNKGVSLDVAADQLSRKLGVEVDPSEYIEFVDRYKNPTEFKKSNISDSQKMLKDKYKELTGRNLTDKIARRTRDRVNRNMTDEQRFELNESLQEVGITYDDIVNYEKYIEETTRSNAVGVQQPNNDQARSKAESPRNQDVQGGEKVTLPKTVLEGVISKLKKTGLANNIKVESTDQIDARKISLPGMFVKGFVDTNGDVVINSDTATLDTPIHEFGHLWTSEVKKNNPDLYQKGIDLIDTDSAKPYIDEVKRLQPSLEGSALKEEVLAQIIGDQGAKLIESNPKTKTIREWLKNVWADIMKRTGISGMTPDQLSNISLEQFAEGVAIDLLQGKSFAVNKDGSLDVKVNVPESGKISPAEQRKIDLINKFKNRAGIQYQALPNNNVLSSSDLKEFHELAEIVINDGTVTSLSEFRSFAKDIGITDKTQVDMIYKSLDKSNQKASGIKKALVDDITVDTASFEKKTDAEVKDMGKQLVDSGVIDPADLIADIITNPKALQPYEVAALVYFKSKLDSEIDALETNTTGLDSDGKPMEYGGVTGMDAVNAKLEMKEMQLADFQMMSLITANQQSQAFRLRDMMVDSDFNIVSYIEEFKRLNKGYISPEKLAEFNALAKRVGELERSLKRAEKKREEAETKIGQNNIQQASKQTGSTKPRISSKKVKEATAKVIASIDPASFGLVTPRFQTNDVVRFSVVPDTVLTDAVNEALAGISTDINNGVQIGDAVENAISSIDSKVGANKWNSSGFRSAVINQYVSEGVKVNSKKPYVSSTGNLVVPSEYLKDLVRDGKETVEDMVEAVQLETDNKYTDYEIRNAISGYGKVATGKVDDITKKINVAKRIAQKLSEIEDLQNKGSRAKTPKRATEINGRLEALKQEVNELERLAGMTPEEYEQFREDQNNEKTNERRRKYIQDHILELEEKIANKDFAPKDYSASYEKDAETLAMEEELIKARNKFKQEKARVEFENRSKAEKVTDVIIDMWNAFRTQAGMDLSSILVQGGLFAYSNPRKALEIFRAGKDVVLSNKDVDNYFDSLQADPIFEVARKAKLRLQLPSFYNQLQEEQFHGNIMKLIIDDLIGGTAGKIVGKLGGDGAKVKEKVSDLNPFNIGDRHYAYTLSATRMHMFKKFAADAELKNGSDLTPDQFKRIANLVNDLTFASGFGKLEGKNFNKWAGIIFYSLPKAVATFKLMSNIVPHQFFHNAKMVNGKIQFDPVSVAIGRELYSNYLLPALTLPMAVIGGYVLAGALAGDDEDKDEFINPNMFNPIHTDFMKLKFGNTRVSSTFGMETVPTLLSRVATGTYMTSSSNEIKETGEGRNFTKGDIIGRFVRNKFAPAMSLTWEHLNKTASQELEYGKKVRESFIPMWITSGIETYEKTDNVGLSSTLGVLGIIGANYNTYGGAEFAQKIKAPKSKKIIEESGLSVYNPTPGSVKVIDADKGVKSEPIDSKELKDKFIPIYAEAMDNLVLTKQKSLAPDLGVSRKSDAINQMKGEALDYAKFKISGVMTGFDSFVSNGVRYKLKPDQYPVKKKAIDEYMSNRGASLIEKQKQSIKKDLIKEGFTPTDGYIQMVAEREVYKKANITANKIIKKMIREGTLSVIESKDFKDKESDSE